MKRSKLKNTILIGKSNEIEEEGDQFCRCTLSQLPFLSCVIYYSASQKFYLGSYINFWKFFHMKQVKSFIFCLQCYIDQRLFPYEILTSLHFWLHMREHNGVTCYLMILCQRENLSLPPKCGQPVKSEECGYTYTMSFSMAARRRNFPSVLCS